MADLENPSRLDVPASLLGKISRIKGYL